MNILLGIIKKTSLIALVATAFAFALQFVAPAKSAHAEVACDLDAVADRQWNYGGYHYVDWKISLVAHGADKDTLGQWMDSRNCGYGNIVSGGSKSGVDWVIKPWEKLPWITGGRAISPEGVSFGLPAGQTHLGCGDAAVSPWIEAKPPVFKYSACREAAVVDDGGAFQINNTTIFCQGLPGAEIGGWSNCGYYPGSKDYPYNGAAGNLFAKFNCVPFSDISDPWPPVTVDCNSTDYYRGTFSWYRRAGSYFAGGANGGGLNNGDGINSLFSKRGDGTLDQFKVHAVAYNTQKGNFATALHLTMKYPYPSVAVTVQASTDNTNFSSYNNVSAPLTIVEGTPLYIRYISLNATTCGASDQVTNGASTMFPYTINTTRTRNKSADATTSTNAKRTSPYMSYKLSCNNEFDADFDIAYIQVKPGPSYPWLQVKFGDTMAFGQIIGQKINVGGVAPGGRNNTAIDKEATYVIISALNSIQPYNQQLYAVPPDKSTSQFCSTKNFQFGSDPTQPTCASGPYVPNIDREFLFPKTYVGRSNSISYSDMVINNFWHGYDDSNRSAATPGDCESNSLARPYAVGGNIGSSLRNDMRAPGLKNCPTVWTITSNSISNGGNPITITYGRASVFYDGDLYINSNIVYSYGNYFRVNDLPNLGIIVRGNVYINSSVTQVDAAIYATKVISTCTDYKPLQFDNNINVACRTNRLTVNGALLARGGFYFGRQVFDSSASAPPAELIKTNGQYLAYPPPGFDNRYGYIVNRVSSPGREAAPLYGF